MVTFSSTGDFKNSERFFRKNINGVSVEEILNEYGLKGVLYLREVTPKDTGNTAMQWDYTITKSKNSFSLSFVNNNIVDGVPVVILLQYGHATLGGGYYPGYDFVNPVIEPLMEQLSNELWGEVTNV